MSSTRRGSLLTVQAISCARSEGLTVPSFTMRPSDFETIFCAITTTSPLLSFSPEAPSPARIIAARSSWGWINGIPGSAMRRTESCLVRSLVSGFFVCSSVTMPAVRPAGKSSQPAPHNHSLLARHAARAAFRAPMTYRRVSSHRTQLLQRDRRNQLLQGALHRLQQSLQRTRVQGIRCPTAPAAGHCCA